MSTQSSMLDEINQKLETIENDLHQLARLEERMAHYRETMSRAFGEIEALEKRIGEMDRRIRLSEEHEPVNKLVREWVLKAVIALAAIGASSALLIKLLGGH